MARATDPFRRLFATVDLHPVEKVALYLLHIATKKSGGCSAAIGIGSLAEACGVDSQREIRAAITALGLDECSSNQIQVGSNRCNGWAFDPEALLAKVATAKESYAAVLASTATRLPLHLVASDFKSEDQFAAGFGIAEIESNLRLAKLAKLREDYQTPELVERFLGPEHHNKIQQIVGTSDTQHPEYAAELERCWEIARAQLHVS